MYDTVNLTSCLESTTKEYSFETIIGEQTALYVDGEISLREIGIIHLKGKSEPVRAFTLERDREMHRGFLSG